MRTIVWVTVLLSALTMGGFASAQDFSFRELKDLPSYEKDLMRIAIEQGQFTPNNPSSSLDITLDGIGYGDEDDLALFVMLIMKHVCPTCSTTSSGSTVKVTYGTSSNGGKNAYVVNSDDYYEARDVEEDCKELLDSHRYERNGKDILIVDNNDDDDKIAMCFDRD